MIDGIVTPPGNVTLFGSVMVGIVTLESAQLARALPHVAEAWRYFLPAFSVIATAPAMLSAFPS